MITYFACKETCTGRERENSFAYCRYQHPFLRYLVSYLVVAEGWLDVHILDGFCKKKESRSKRFSAVETKTQNNSYAFTENGW